MGPDTHLAPALVLSGAGVSTGIPPTQKAVVSAVQPYEIGQASGVFAMLRQFGALFGTAVAVAVFAGSGSYADPQSFTDGFTAAISVGAGLAAVGALAALMLPKLRRAATAPAGTGTPEREPVAAG